MTAKFDLVCPHCNAIVERNVASGLCPVCGEYMDDGKTVISVINEHFENPPQEPDSLYISCAEHLINAERPSFLVGEKVDVDINLYDHLYDLTDDVALNICKFIVSNMEKKSVINELSKFCVEESNSR